MKLFYYSIIIILATSSCSPRILNSSQPNTEITCPNGSKRIQVSCSSVSSLKERVAKANIGIPKLGLGFGGSYEERALGHITEGTQQLAVSLESKCQQYNACAISSSEWVETETVIRNQLTRHVDLTTTLKQTQADIQIGNTLYSNAVPGLSKERLSFGYSLDVVDKNGIFHPHTSGAPLPSQSEFRIRIQVNQQAYVYILLLSSQGEATVLFPMTGIAQTNPLTSGTDIAIPQKDTGIFALDDVVGTEHLQLIVSTKPLDDIEARLTALQSQQNGQGKSANLLKTIGGMLCDGQDIARSRGINFKPSSVDCGGITTRGIRLKPTSENKQVVHDQLVSRPFDTVVVAQHTIEHVNRF